MKKIIYIAFSLIFTLFSCENVDFGDTNENPNGASEADAASLLAAAMSRYSTLTGRNYLTRPTLYVQYQSQVTYTDEMLYSESAADWYSYYVQTLSNLQLVIDLNLDEENHTITFLNEGDPENQIAVAQIFQTIIFKRLTDTYGDIPYSEALADIDNLTPAYDSQNDIYEGMISTLKESRDMIDETGVGPTGDIIYDGDVTKWKKLANSLILQLSLQLSKKYPNASEYAAIEFNGALNDAAGVIEEISDEAWFYYDENFNNPWSAQRTTDYFLSLEFTNALKGLGTTSNSSYDSRIEVFAKSPTLDGVAYGYSDGSGVGKTGMSSLIWNLTAPLQLMTSSYTYLNRADAANLGWTSENSASLLALGIQQSYATLDDHYGTSISTESTAYSAARVVDMSTIGATQVIAEEKWVSLFPSGFDAWSEWRRTEYPTLVPATDYLNSGVIPRRYIYPTDEFSLNPSSYASGVQSLVPATDNNSSKIWWDQ
ncbi:SusD/RagB family nutrient-binding outer membrane lipoprotein [Cellulophaga sp. L1A9]|uniref:SusD/RagB family nutrient-binding outer membrane lipoprotein n=1 Tax=Cellulophaga sp. L1A9 TaxID=2686362 RepID=UPI00131D5CF7|nr:SusD/RagB family nutrient-binding outer membrane lipoprotein [Cellulophaga sp. L1A9]